MSAQRTFRLYIDESGNHQMGGKCERYLGLLGVIIPLDTYGSIFKPAMLRIKREYFSGDPDSPILFHREEVTQRKGPFAVLDNDSHRAKFNGAMLDFYRTQTYTLIAVVIDKESHRNVYRSAAKHPYHYCAEAMMERYFFFLSECGGRGDVFAESRSGDQDRLFQAEWQRLCHRGNFYIRAQ